MKFFTLLLILISTNSFACKYSGEGQPQNHFLETMKSNTIVVIATVERTYHRKDKCTVKKFCSTSGLVINVKEILKGDTPKYIEGYTATYSSCYSEFHPVNWQGTNRTPSYIVGKEYLFVLKQEIDDYVVLAGKELKLSLNLIKEFKG